MFFLHSLYILGIVFLFFVFIYDYLIIRVPLFHV